MNTFMQVFTDEKKAHTFAKQHLTNVIRRYKYDIFYRKIIEEFVVYFN